MTDQDARDPMFTRAFRSPGLARGHDGPVQGSGPANEVSGGRSMRCTVVRHRGDHVPPSTHAVLTLIVGVVVTACSTGPVQASADQVAQQPSTVEAPGSSTTEPGAKHRRRATETPRSCHPARLCMPSAVVALLPARRRAQRRVARLPRPAGRRDPRPTNCVCCGSSGGLNA